MAETIIVAGISNREFLEKHAAPGRIGLVGGPELINRLIERAQRHLAEDEAWSQWSHAFLFQGRRHDGHHWVIESDLDIKHKHIRLGVQENRIEKYFDDTRTTNVAILDLGLTPEQIQQVMASALQLVSEGTRYSLREIAGTLWAMRHPRWRPRENLLVRERAFYCSAFVRHIYGQAGIELAREVAVKNTAPEHIYRTELPHTRWILSRPAPPAGRVRRLAQRVRTRLKKSR